MANRYGRNQRRKARARIEELEREVASLNTMLQRAKWDAESMRLRAEDPYQAAFKEFAKNSGLIREGIRRLTDVIGERLGKELMPYAERVLDEYHNQGVLMSLRASIVKSGDYVEITCSIPSIHARVNIARPHIF